MPIPNASGSFGAKFDARTGASGGEAAAGTTGSGARVVWASL